MQRQVWDPTVSAPDITKTHNNVKQCHLLTIFFFIIKNVFMRGFPAGSVVENPLANAGDMGSTPDLG